MLYNLEPIFTIALSHFIIISIFSSSFHRHTDSLVNTQGEEENNEEKESKERKKERQMLVFSLFLASAKQRVCVINMSSMFA